MELELFKVSEKKSKYNQDLKIHSKSLAENNNPFTVFLFCVCRFEFKTRKILQSNYIA